jgi:hypothetical protein
VQVGECGLGTSVEIGEWYVKLGDSYDMLGECLEWGDKSQHVQKGVI